MNYLVIRKGPSLAIVLVRSVLTFQSNKREAEGLEWVGLSLVVKDHPVCRQVKPAALFALEGGPLLSSEAHRHIVAEEQDATNRVKKVIR